ncbi:hypothetical protein [Sphingomonas colocasiae]|uniref:Uncharacterized protein n=1 Tax=Sphingomonas colocasiae TaxID=1848973 RepID=A0ABS7PT50_9SPHN|nr:hypothetical protein [Sphingomonas colocasiae]MBY8824512.1 hypothetical protein [Sphingomonas colocasiae]
MIAQRDAILHPEHGSRSQSGTELRHRESAAGRIARLGEDLDESRLKRRRCGKCLRRGSAVFRRVFLDFSGQQGMVRGHGRSELFMICSILAGTREESSLLHGVTLLVIPANAGIQEMLIIALYATGFPHARE